MMKFEAPIQIKKNDLPAIILKDGRQYAFVANVFCQSKTKIYPCGNHLVGRVMYSTRTVVTSFQTY